MPSCFVECPQQLHSTALTETWREVYQIMLLWNISTSTRHHGVRVFFCVTGLNKFIFSNISLKLAILDNIMDNLANFNYITTILNFYKGWNFIISVSKILGESNKNNGSCISPFELLGKTQMFYLLCRSEARESSNLAVLTNKLTAIYSYLIILIWLMFNQP